MADPPADAGRTRGDAGARAPGRTGASGAEALQALAREAPVGIFRADAGGDYVYTNERWCRIAGIEPPAAAGRGWFSAVHPDDRHRVTELWLQAVAAAAPFDLEYRLRRPDGTSSWVLGQAVPLGGGREASGYVGTITDITVHKRLQELLRGENRILELVATDAPLREVMERLARLIESQADGIIASVLFLDEAGERITTGAAPSLPETFVQAIEGVAIGPNVGSCGTAMYRRETVVVEDILTDPLWDDYRALASAHGLRACWSMPILARDGRALGSFAMYYRDVRRPSEYETGLVATATHIARVAIERHAADASLRKSEETYRALVDDAPYGILRATSEGRLLTVNPRLVEILGYREAEELLRRDLGTEVFTEPGEWRRFVAEVDAHGRAAVEATWRARDGRAVSVLLTSRLRRRGAEEEETSYQAVVQDVTETRELEEQLRHSQRMEAIGRLAGGVAHDFNNILTAILGYSDLVLAGLDPEGENHGFVTEIRDAANRAAALTHQLLAFGRKQVLRPMVYPVNEIVESVAGMLRRLLGEHIELEVDLDPTAGHARVDRGQIEQVVLNLAVNARDSMPTGGRLGLRTARRASTDAASGRDWSVIAVADTGRGISPENQERIFEPFFSTRVLGQGSGLGLATAYGIVDQSGGTILVDSAVGRGTTFEVLLPAAAPAAAETPVPTPAARSGEGERVLLVEDEPAVRAALRALLEARGFAVEEAADAESALASMARLGDDIALTVTDMVLPGMSGAELAAALRSRDPGAPILFISGYSEEAVHGGAGLDEGTAFLAKPFTAEVLERTIRGLLGR